MAAALPSVGSCCDTCDDQISVLVPGPAAEPGDDGDPGTDGVNAFTTLTAAFTVPAVAATVLVQVQNSTWMAAGQKLFIQNAGYYQFVSSTSTTNATIQNLGYTGNAVPTTVVAVSNKISPGGVKGADGAAGSASGFPLTTKGDLFTYAGANARLAVGTNLQILHADSTQATGLRWGGIDLAAGGTLRTNDLPIADGGTGQGTAVAAFNALSPVTTRGDIIVRDATNNVRLPVGTVGQVLRSDGTDAAWGKIVPANIDMASGPLPRYGLLGSLIGANFNSTADQAITIQTGAARYIIRRIVVDNASISLSTAAGGIYSNAAKAGTIIVAAAQVYSALTASTKFLDLTLTAIVGTDILTAGTLYLSLSTAQGAAATSNLFIFGENVTP